TTSRTGANKSSGPPLATIRLASAAANVAVTVAVGASGPAITKGSELRMARTKALIALVTKVAATPYASHGDTGPEKMSAANDSPTATARTLLIRPAKKSPEPTTKSLSGRTSFCVTTRFATIRRSRKQAQPGVPLGGDLTLQEF